MNEDNKRTITEADIERILAKVGPLATPPPEMTEKIKSTVKAQWQAEVSARRRGIYYRLAAVVAAVSLTTYFGLFLIPVPDAQVIASLDTATDGIEVSADGVSFSPLESTELHKGDYLRTNSASLASVTFERQMNMRIAGNSVVALLTDHQVGLKGGAIYLDSAGRADDTPFVVITDHGRAVDIGTQFIVATTPAEWSVQVREGLVNVADGDARIQLLAGDQLKISVDDEVQKLSVPAYDESWRWTQAVRPHYNLEGQKLSDYLAWVARETGRQLRYLSIDAQDNASTTFLHGSIDSLTAEESVTLVLKSTSLELIESAKDVMIVGVSDGP